MTEWNHTVDIKKHLSRDTSDAACKETGKNIAADLRMLAHRTTRYEETDLDFIIEDLDGVTDVLHLNEILVDLYDWADEEKVWLGTRV